MFIGSLHREGKSWVSNCHTRGICESGKIGRHSWLAGPIKVTDTAACQYYSRSNEIDFIQSRRMLSIHHSKKETPRLTSDVGFPNNTTGTQIWPKWLFYSFSPHRFWRAIQDRHTLTELLQNKTPAKEGWHDTLIENNRQPWSRAKYNIVRKAPVQGDCADGIQAHRRGSRNQTIVRVVNCFTYFHLLLLLLLRFIGGTVQGDTRTLYAQGK